MANTMENLKTINSFVRTMLGLVVVGAMTVAGWFGYSTYYEKDMAIKRTSAELENIQAELQAKDSELQHKTVQLKEKDETIAGQQQQISSLNEEVREKEEQIARLDTALRLLKIDHRLARITVVDVGQDGTGKMFSEIEFVEVNDEGEPIDEPRVFRLEGDVVYVDCWTVKFDDKYIEQADLDRSTSLCLFRRIFGEYQEPSEGYPLDRPGTRPTAYARGGMMSEFEKKIWSDFWTVANDPQLQKGLGIRAAHGDAVSIKVVRGKTYKVELRASGGLSLVPENRPTPQTANSPVRGTGA